MIEKEFEYKLYNKLLIIIVKNDVLTVRIMSITQTILQYLISKDLLLSFSGSYIRKIYLKSNWQVSWFEINFYSDTWEGYQSFTDAYL